MSRMEEAVRARFQEISEPDLRPSPDLLLRVRRAHRRQDMRISGLLLGVSAVAGVAVTSLVADAPASRQDMITPSAPSPTPSASQEAGCAGSHEPASAVVREIFAFEWPSGSAVATVRSDNGCDYVVGLVTTTVSEADKHAAAERWGDLVRLEVTTATHVP